MFTDKVVSMNDKVNKVKKIQDFKAFQINLKIMDCAKKDAIFLHCLPRGPEVSNDVFLGKNQKFGNKHSIEFMYKKVFYYIVLVN